MQEQRAGLDLVCIAAAVVVGCGTPSGSHSSGQPRPRVRTSSHRAVQIAVGDAHSCARMESGEIVCWGSDYEGQLGGRRGTGIWSAVVEPTVVSELGTAIHVAAGGTNTCAWDKKHVMRCLGGTEYGPLEHVDHLGQLDDPPGSHPAPRHPSTPHSGYDVMRQTTVLTSPSGFRDVASIALIDGHRCMVTTGGTVACSGQNRSGQLGDGTKEPILHPKVVAGLSDVVEVASSYEHTCVRKSDGGVACWGANAAGELGDGTTVDHLAPRPVIGLEHARQISTSSDRSCAVLADATVSCWGFDTTVGAGCPGDDVIRGTRVLEATAVPALTHVAQVALGDTYGCARMLDGTVRCWGQNLDGRLGIEARPADALSCRLPCLMGPCTTRPRDEAEPAYWFHRDPLVTELRDIVDLRVANTHVCALDRSGGVWCWGANRAGQIGDGTHAAAYRPVKVRW